MSKEQFKIGDRVKMAPMWKYAMAVGVITKITKDYTVVSWEGINGDWHYTTEQATKLQYET
jgi:hypothetical protein